MTRDELLRNKPLIIGGPCSISSKEQILKIGKLVEEAGATAIRAQLWKPRTRPDSFQGVGDEGLEWIKQLKQETNLAIVCEVTAQDQVAKLRDIADVLWVGSRNMQNYELLKTIADDGRPVILKRGFISTMKEWLGCADYIGRDKVILCERGIRTGADSMRFTLDLNSVLIAKHDYNMPVIVDPSHTAGRRDMVPYLALAGITIGADGLVVETHYAPEEEKVDKDQTIHTDVFKILVREAQELYNVVKEPDWKSL